MLPFLAVGGYYSSPTKNIGEKGAFSSIIALIANFITAHWIFFTILLLLLLLILAYFIYRKIRRKSAEDSANNSSQPVSDAF